jgi:hypothetical protein
VPKPLKFLRPHYDRIKAVYEAYTNPTEKVIVSNCFYHKVNECRGVCIYVNIYVCIHASVCIDDCGYAFVLSDEGII